MPKKRVPKYDFKPSSPAHPSLASSASKHRDAPHSLGLSSPTSGNSVNDRLQELRLSQRPSLSPGSQIGRPSSDVLSPGANPSLPPSLRNILQIPEAPAPRPRPNLRVAGRIRNPAGPAAPASWLRRNEDTARAQKARIPAHLNGKAFHVESLPGSYIPDDRSLVATTLKAVAKNWDWHQVYDQYYLPTILVRYKEALLHYIARFSDHGIDRIGLDLLFQDDFELEDATGAEGLTHLDLATSVSHPLKLSDLRPFFSSKEVAGLPDVDCDSTPQSWDDFEVMKGGLSAMGRFDSLTHLSLAHPNSAATWKGLLDIAPHLSTITHLSLAYWPTPTMSPNSKTAYRETPQGNVNFGASHFYSSMDQDWSEAASILRRLSKSTYCLQWLDLTGCYPWVQAIADPKIDWFGAWRALETVKVCQGWLHECFQSGAGETAWKDIFRQMRMRTNHDMEQRQLLEWVEAERNTLKVETAVNERITAATRAPKLAEGIMEPAVIGATQDAAMQASAWQSQFSVDEVRTSRVKFERGWDAWWIKDAVEQIQFTGDDVARILF